MGIPRPKCCASRSGSLKPTATLISVDPDRRAFISKTIGPSCSCHLNWALIAPMPGTFLPNSSMNRSIERSSNTLALNCAAAFQSTLHGNRVAHYANRIIEEAHGDFSALDMALKTIVLWSRLEKGLQCFAIVQDCNALAAVASTWFRNDRKTDVDRHLCATGHRRPDAARRQEFGRQQLIVRRLDKFARRQRDFGGGRKAMACS